MFNFIKERKRSFFLRLLFYPLHVLVHILFVSITLVIQTFFRIKSIFRFLYVVGIKMFPPLVDRDPPKVVEELNTKMAPKSVVAFRHANPAYYYISNRSGPLFSMWEPDFNSHNFHNRPIIEFKELQHHSTIGSYSLFLYRRIEQANVRFSLDATDPDKRASAVVSKLERELRSFENRTTRGSLIDTSLIECLSELVQIPFSEDQDPETILVVLAGTPIRLKHIRAIHYVNEYIIQRDIKEEETDSDQDLIDAMNLAVNVILSLKSNNDTLANTIAQVEISRKMGLHVLK